MPAPRRARAILALSVAAFVVLALAALLAPTPAVEAELRQALLRLDAGIAGDVLRAIDHAGTWKVILPGSLLLFALSSQARARWWIWAVALLAAPAAETFFKFAIGRPRPEALTMGFPSGHATASAAFFGAVIYLAAPLSRVTRYAVRTLAVICIVLVAMGRVALGAHWPTDALAGVALGVTLASAAHLLGMAPPRAAAGGGIRATRAGEAPRRPLP
jgi:membrane-associated phospholipid phosphatase